MSDQLEPANAAQLADYLLSVINPATEEVAKKYVIYARKSTKGDERQERSIEDQISDCFELQVKRNDLNVVETIRERYSAKEPGRPLFKEMMDGLNTGKYNSVLAWHPDRLSRNMKDAGEIIYMLEIGVIKDLRFATYTFEDSPMGKMLLGMSFVMSKQYSDHLSETVTRGQKKIIQGGQYIHVPKHGYKFNKSGYLVPDGLNWTIIQNAFGMRQRGVGLQKITDYINSSGYLRAPSKRKRRKKTYTIDQKRVSNLLRDTFYAGVLIWNKQVINLKNQYDFKPILTVTQFLSITKLDKITKNYKSVARALKKSVKADLFRNIIICGECGEPFHSGITRDKKGGSRYYFRCENKSCSFLNKSVRAKTILDFVYDFVASQDLSTREWYQYTKKQAEKDFQERFTEMKSELNSLRKKRVDNQDTYKRIKRQLIDDPSLKKHLVQDLDSLSDQKLNLDRKIDKLEKVLDKKDTLLPSYEKYLETYKKLAHRLKFTPNMKFKDTVAKKFFLNIIVTPEITSTRKDGKPVIQWEVTDYELTPTYRKLRKIYDGRGGGTRTSGETFTTIALVGVAGLEPAASRPPALRASQLRHTPLTQ